MSWQDIINQGNGIKINQEIDNYLLNNGFKYGDYYGEEGFLLISKDGDKTTTVLINRDKVRYAIEWEYETTIDGWEQKIIDEGIFDSVDKFKEYMDEIF